ncbi:LysR substrate-binding domain-containing protein [Sphingomonas colocasiae]|uniref:LysR family transcriptional regulator n=1 Tax=Sphingomonas colocasiae TaxID=1848973 RepID=A0ABS7PHV9_9SPHN|nr:LysR substrate-binding domain-containing protein [Sphingomonas colocasiae]MBY8820885.1 LysR family transcriptional regulator [Sphingomonas colocasiae]
MSIEPDWEQYRAFLAVLREGSLSAAARALAIAQPTMRRRIEDLEAQLGTALFTRTPGGLQPTETGLALRGHAEAMALAAAALIRSASSEAGEIAGTVRVSASEVIAVEILPPMLARLQAAHPALVIELSPSNRNEDVLRREADVAVRMVAPVQTALIARRAGAVRLGLHARRDYLARRGMPETLEAMRGHALIGVERDSPVLRALRASGLPMAIEDCCFRSDSDLAQLAAIRAGLGIGICQSALAARDPALRPVLPGAFGFDLETWIVCHENLRNVARVRAVFDALVRGLSDYAGTRVVG